MLIFSVYILDFLINMIKVCNLFKIIIINLFSNFLFDFIIYKYLLIFL